MESSVHIYTSPWVQNTRAAAYFGPISTETFLADEDVGLSRESAWAKATVELMEALRTIAAEKGANAVVGMEFTADPFFERDGRMGIKLHVVGTAAKLEPLF